MTAAGISRDNHYVPQAYLRRWADADQRVWTYRVLVSHPEVPLWRRVRARGIAYREYLYTRIVAGHDSDDFERWLDEEFETPAQDAIARAVSGRHMSYDHWQALIRYAFAQNQRTPARMTEILRRQQDTFPEIAQDTLRRAVRMLEEKSANPDAPRASPRIDATGLPVRVRREPGPDASKERLHLEALVGRSSWLWGLRQLLTTSIAKAPKYDWTILQCPPGRSWITSDDPVVRLNFYRDGRYDFRGGWGRRGTEILFPLSPSALLYTQVGKKPPRQKTASVVQVDRLNWILAKHASRLVFAQEPTDWVRAVRPRTVDRAAFNEEQKAWAQWHRVQSDAEQEFGM